MINTVEPLHERVYRITEVHSLHRYLLLGDDKALLIDTGYGFEDITPIIRNLTNLPLMVINTHGHADHTMGNYFFDEVYIHPKDIPLVAAEDTIEKKRAVVAYRTKKNPALPKEADLDAFLYGSMAHVRYQPVIGGDQLELGNISCSVIEVPGHTAGSIALYCPQLKCLFGGDSINSHPIWYLTEAGAMPLPLFLRSLERLKKQELDIQAVYPGHGNVPLTMDVVDQLIACIYDLAADKTMDPVVENSGLIGRQHNYKGTAIIYSDDQKELLCQAVQTGILER